MIGDTTDGFRIVTTDVAADMFGPSVDLGPALSSSVPVDVEIWLATIQGHRGHQRLGHHGGRRPNNVSCLSGSELHPVRKGSPIGHTAHAELEERFWTPFACVA
jgi:hypothetical protein